MRRVILVALLLIAGATALTTQMRLTQPIELFATFYGATLVVKLLVALIAIRLAAFGQRMYREIWR